MQRSAYILHFVDTSKFHWSVDFPVFLQCWYELEFRTIPTFVHFATHLNLYRQSEHWHNAVHGLVFPAHRAWAIRLVVPEARTGRMQTGTVLLHDHAGDDILVRFLQFGKDSQAHFDHDAGPVVDLVVLIRIATDRILDGLLNDLADVIHDELVLRKIMRRIGLAWEFDWISFVTSAQINNNIALTSSCCSMLWRLLLIVFLIGKVETAGR